MIGRFGPAGFAATALVAGIAAALAVAAGPATAAQEPDASEAQAEAAGDRLGEMIGQAIRADGPFFTAEERAVIEHACGYAPGSWDGFEANMSDGAFHCGNGRRVDTPEVRAVMEAAAPRIGARVSAVMASPGVREAIAEVSRRAAADALASIDAAEIAREALAEARADIEEARREAEAARRRR